MAGSLDLHHVDAFVGTKSLLQLMGSEWKVHRKLISKAFSWQNLVVMVPSMTSIADDFASVLLKSNAESIDVAPLLKLLTLDIIGATAFGSSFNAIHDAKNPIMEGFTLLLEDFNHRMIEAPFHPGSKFYWLPTKANKLHRATTQSMRQLIDDLVASRMKSTSNETYHDLLQFMIAAAHEENSGVTAQSFADNLLTFLFAGFDTTSISLSYALYLMASHPDVQEKALAENLFITESLRLFPPALVTSRTLEDEVTIGKHRIPRGTTVMLPIYWIHRYDANWGSDADRFRPERHLEDSDDINLSAKDKGFRMLAFSGGPRNCVGMRYAMLETVVVLAVLLQRCVFSVAKDAPPVRPVVSGLVQKPEHGVWLNIQPRKA
ncbi:hypothetical protein Ae201684P_000581 [Aphanomyces euteiches]|uniref:Cytochrome P450 n=1 Tax=Aphanomyces euteiches TaxID=100861 RepID=A0A6G0XQB1_9STRA|nr:hypothetical protein Ae201684_002341 [Aphanomyces euteiches]KAH9087169.1 hypothetical protein Ae201684P_000581 [Aphanomyces euteiches]KAH9151719.1 hypothetical protein AeRB84_005723 [Aphanomyces euteiches]